MIFIGTGGRFHSVESLVYLVALADAEVEPRTGYGVGFISINSGIRGYSTLYRMTESI